MMIDVGRAEEKDSCRSFLKVNSRGQENKRRPAICRLALVAEIVCEAIRWDAQVEWNSSLKAFILV
jgi:hypothetical protein